MLVVHLCHHLRTILEAHLHLTFKSLSNLMSKVLSNIHLASGVNHLLLGLIEKVLLIGLFEIVFP